jgi:Tol biopolymer transport system component
MREAFVVATTVLAVAACGKFHDRAAGTTDAGNPPAEDSGAPDDGVPTRDASADARASEDSGRGTDAGGQGGRGGAGGADASGGNAGDSGGDSMQPCVKTADNAVGGLELVTLSTACTAGDGDASHSSLTPDGRYVVFESDAPDLVPGDLNGFNDVFLVELETGAIELISKRFGGNEPGMGHAWKPVASDDARYVAFIGYSFELTSPPPEDGFWVYVRDRITGTTRQLGADYACAYSVDMSGDGAFIVAEGNTRCDGGHEDGDFDSALEYRMPSGEMRHLEIEGSADNYRPQLSRDGRFLVWGSRPPMTRGGLASQLHVFDRDTQAVETLPMLGFHYGSIAISDDGNVVAYAHNQQVYRYDRGAEELTLVSQDSSGAPGDDFSDEVSMSGDGRRIVFRSRATNLISDDTNGTADILLFDTAVDGLERLSVAPDGVQADGDCKKPHISGDGSKVSFTCKARNLLPAATNGNYQIYVRTLAVE